VDDNPFDQFDEVNPFDQFDVKTPDPEFPISADTPLPFKGRTITRTPDPNRPGGVVIEGIGSGKMANPKREAELNRLFGSLEEQRAKNKDFPYTPDTLPPPVKTPQPKNPFDAFDAKPQPAQQADMGSLSGDLEASWYQLRQALAGNELVAGQLEETSAPSPRFAPRAGALPKTPQEVETQRLRGAGRQGPAIQDIAKFAGKIKAIPESPAATAFNNSKTFGEAWDNFWTDPLAVTRSTVARSAAISLPSVVGGIVGSVFGPVGAAGGAGAGSYTAEMGSAIAEQLIAHGADINNPESIKQVWAQHKDDITKKAHERALIVGGVDALTGGVGSKIAALPGVGLVKKEIAGTAVEGVGGAVGEAAAEYNEDGTLKPGAIAGEFLGEIGSGAVQQAGQIAVEGVKKAVGSQEAKPLPEEPTPRIEPQLPPVNLPPTPPNYTGPTENAVAPAQPQAPVAPAVGQAPMAPREIKRPVASPKGQETPSNVFDQFDAPGETKAPIAETIPPKAETPAPGAAPMATRDGSRQAPVKAATTSELAPAREQVNTEPSEAQKESGNYRKGHAKVHGIDFSIENPRGSVRRGTSSDGTPWESPPMPADYAYIKRSVGADSDQVDAFLGPDLTSDRVFGIDQIDLKTGKFDESKFLFGVHSAADAEQVYDASFSDGKGPQRRRAIREVSVDEFRNWLENGNTKAPFARQRNTQSIQDAGIQGLEKNAPTVQQSEGRSVFELRGKRAEDSSGVEQGLPVIPEGNRAEAKSELNAGPDRQREGLPSGQRPLGDETAAGREPPQHKIGDAKRAKDDSDQSSQGPGSAPSVSTTTAETGNVGKRSASSGEASTRPEGVTRTPRPPVVGRSRGSYAAEEDVAITATGREVPVKYSIVEAADLVASERDEGGANPDYPEELQPRDRDRAVSQQQIQDIAQRLDPRLLGKSPKASDGSPIISEDGTVESGNGRVLAIRRAYAKGMPGAAKYRDYLQRQGYLVEGMTAPVLVRVRQGQMKGEDRQAFTREANERDTLAMSATERAMSDAKAMPDQVLELYRGGEISAAGNRDFVKGFIRDVVAKNDQANLVAADGSISQEAIRRIESALLAKAYGDETLIAKLVESPDSNIKAIGGALLDVAPQWAQMRAEADKGDISPDVDQTKNLLAAVRMVERARTEERPLSLLVGQTDIFSGTAMDPLAEAFLSLMYRNTADWKQPVGRAPLAEALGVYVTEARKTSAGTDLLGETAAAPSDILAVARRKQQGGETTDDQPKLDLAKRPGERPGEGAGTPSQERTPPPAPREEASAREAVAPKSEPEVKPADPYADGVVNPPFDERIQKAMDAGKTIEQVVADIRDEGLPKSAEAYAHRRLKDYVPKAKPTSEKPPINRPEKGSEGFAEGEKKTGIHNYQPLNEFSEASPAKLASTARDYVLKQGAKHGVEVILAFDKAGNIVSDGRGSGSNVGFSKQFSSMMTDREQELVIHHNHPRGTSLSAPDIAMFAAYGIKSMWAYGANGQIYRANLNPGIREAAIADHLFRVLRDMDSLMGSIYDVLQKRVLDKSLHPVTAGDVHAHLRNEALHKAGVIHYFTNQTFAIDVELAAALNDVVSRIKEKFRDENIAIGGPAQPVRYAGDMGILFDRTEDLAARRPDAKPPGPGQRDNRPQAVRGQHLRFPGFEEPDSPARQPPFYSALIRAVEGMKQPRAPASQWLGMIKNAQGVKPEEIAWLGLEDWLNSQTGAVTKEALADFLRANQVEVKEVLKGQSSARQFNSVDRAKEFAAHQFALSIADLEENYGYSDPADYISLANSLGATISDDKAGTKFQQYQLPGGENYRELLLTLPAQSATLPAGYKLTKASSTGEWVVHDGSGKILSAAPTKQEAIDKADSNRFTASHFTEPNILAHVRFNERKDVDGKKVLFIEEIQSDWHQKGRKGGYKQKTVDTSDFKVVPYPPYGAEAWEVIAPEGHPIRSNVIYANTEADALAKAREFAQADVNRGVVPDAPFKTAWPELAMKRMIRWAAENGFDRVAWTPGEVQADRYDLSKQIKELEVFHHRDGSYRLMATPNGRDDPVVQNLMPDKLADFIGKDMAKKIVDEVPKVLTEAEAARRLELIRSSAPKTTAEFDELKSLNRREQLGASGKTFTGLDLTVGGEGMKGFYDKMLVDVANKLGKKFGAKVGRAEIPQNEKTVYVIEDATDEGGGRELFRSEDQREAAEFETAQDGGTRLVIRKGGSVKAHSLDITPAMRESVMAGQPLFNQALTSTSGFFTGPSREELFELQTKIDKVSDKILGHRIKWKMIQYIPDREGRPSRMLAAFDPNTRMIELALSKSQDFIESFGHEALHALRELGVFTPDEWKLLKGEIKRASLNDRPIMDEIRDRYDAMYRESMDLTEEQHQDLLMEEAVAFMMGAHVAGKVQLRPGVGRLIDKIMQFLEAIINAARGYGFRTGKGVRDDILSGKMKERPTSEGEGRGYGLKRRTSAPKPYAENPTASPAFMDWFGDSKVVDAKGKPLVVYHGSNSNISQFDKRKLGKQTNARSAKFGFFFTDEPAVASSYADKTDFYMEARQGMHGKEVEILFNSWVGPAFELYQEFLMGLFGKTGKPTGQNVLPVYLKMENPAILDMNGADYSEQALTPFLRQAVADGHDGAIIKDVVDPGPSINYGNGAVLNPSTHFVVFSPEQIKSIFNRGTWDPDRASILFNAPPAGTPDPSDMGKDEASKDALEDLAGNINLHYLLAPDDIKAALKDISEKASGFIDARRGVQTNAMTAQLAKEMGMKPKELLERKTGAAFNAEEIFAARVMMMKSIKRLAAMAAQAKNSQSLADAAEFMKAYTRHVAIQEQIAGMTAEAGRALQQFKMMAGDTYFQAAERIIDAAKSKDKKRPLGAKNKLGQEAAIDLAQMIDALNDPAQISKFTREAFKVTIFDMIREYWINALLSGPRTHVTNILSNTITALWQVPETALASTIGLLHGGEKVRVMEATARLAGLIEGTKDGMTAAWATLKTGEPTDLASKLENHRKKAIPGLLGTVIRTPGTLLMAEDELFKAMNYRAEIHALATRTALREKKKGAALSTRISELVHNPTAAMKKAAHEAAVYNTFQTKLGPIGSYVMGLREKIPGAYLIAPFIRTPANIMKYAAERTPLGLVMQGVRENLSGKNGNVARDTQISRMVLGSAIAAVIASYVMAGMISGAGPDDPDERNVLRAAGWQPYSVKIGDTWYSYQRFDPFALIVGVTADMVELGEAVREADAGKIGAMIISSISGNLLDKTWLSGPSNFIAAVQDPQRYGDSYIRGFAGSVVPAIVNQANQINDPVLRDARTMLDTIKSRLPYFSQSLPPRRNIFGEEIVREGALGPDILSTVFMSTDKENLIAKEMVRLDYFPSMPTRNINGHPLSPEQYDKYTELAGKGAVKLLERRVALPAWGKRQDDANIKAIRDAYEDARERARAEMKRLYPELRKKPE
jgi:hypothetical protein